MVTHSKVTVIVPEAPSMVNGAPAQSPVHVVEEDDAVLEDEEEAEGAPGLDGDVPTPLLVNRLCVEPPLP